MAAPDPATKVSADEFRTGFAEETGFEVEVDAPGPAWSIEYTYRKRSGTEVTKRVDFYLMRITGGDPRRHDDEVAEVAVLPPTEAILLLTYPNEREAVRALLCG